MLLITHHCRLLCLELHIAEEVIWIVTPASTYAQLLLSLLFHLLGDGEVGELANLVLMRRVLVSNRIQLMALLSTTYRLLIWCLLPLELAWGLSRVTSFARTCRLLSIISHHLLFLVRRWLVLGVFASTTGVRHADDSGGRVMRIGLVDRAGCSPRYEVRVLLGLQHVVLAFNHFLITLGDAKLGNLELLQVLCHYGVGLLLELEGRAACKRLRLVGIGLLLLLQVIIVMLPQRGFIAGQFLATSLSHVVCLLLLVADALVHRLMYIV